MAKRKRAKPVPKAPAPKAKRQLSSVSNRAGLEGESGHSTTMGPTHRLLATLVGHDAPAMTAAVAKVCDECGLKEICDSGDYGDVMDMEQADMADAVLFREFGIAILRSDSKQVNAVQAAAHQHGMIVEPEYWNHSMVMPHGWERASDAEPEQPGASLEYLRGYRDALTQAIAAIEDQESATDTDVSMAVKFVDSAAATWGLQATGVADSSYSGAGIKVAVLDSGCDASHPDLADRGIDSESFIPPAVDTAFGGSIPLPDRSPTVDRAGHGTHCIGTACGPQTPGVGPRYGVAHSAEIYNAKVLSVIPGNPRASGLDSWILAGIRWAIRKGCTVISMSFGSNTAQMTRYPAAYEELANSALENQVLMIAAAGNESDRRRGSVAAVSRPANCPSIASVGAIDRFLGIANFSNRQLYADGGEINLVGPGVGVLSSYPMPARRKLLDGTSMATPHAAGIAALVQEETGKTGMDLYKEVRSRAKTVGQRSDFGNGIVHI